MSKGGETTSTQQAAPWAAQQPYLKDVFQNAQGTYQNLMGNGGANSVAPFTPFQNEAFGLTQGLANRSNYGGIDATNAANNYTTNLLNGGYLNANPGNAAFGAFANGSMMNNPYLSQMANAASNDITRNYQTAVAPQITSQMEGSGRYGSGAMMNAQSQSQQDLAHQLGNSITGLYGNAYQQGMSNMLQGAQGLSNNFNTAAQQQLAGSMNAPALQNSSLGLVNNLYGMGGAQQGYAQNVLNAPFDLLGKYSQLVQGNYGGQSSSSQPYFTNPGAGALGGALAGAKLGTSIPVLGTGLGAAIGGLAGLL